MLLFMLLSIVMYWCVLLLFRLMFFIVLMVYSVKVLVWVVSSWVIWVFIIL